MDIKELIDRAKEVREKYAALEKEKNDREWTRQELVQGFVADVGDLVKLTMAKDGLREIMDADRKLAHELSDCLWSIFVIADKYGIDLEKEYLKTMDELEKRIENSSGFFSK